MRSLDDPVCWGWGKEWGFNGVGGDRVRSWLDDARWWEAVMWKKEIFSVKKR